MKELVIWQNIDVNIEDYEDELREDGITDESDMLDTIYNWLDTDLECDRCIFRNINLPSKILCFADLGLWDGRHKGFREFDNLADTLYTDCDYVKWYCDDTDFMFEGHHHDGCNHYTYRVLREDLTENEVDEFYDIANSYSYTESDINKYTKSIKPYIEQAFGF